MPITISDKRRSEMYAAIEGGIDDLRLALVKANIMTMLSPTDLIIMRAGLKIYHAVLAAAEGRAGP